MILKSIEIRGFKSFADFTELIFNKGITAIVGPNGSGKSNISDAIKWCLGEQSVKNLRGGKMEDVIFSGTQFRKPVSLAQVSLTIDNSKGELPIDYNTLTVSRKLYRSGESEYLINNKTCKLRDIHELFFDTGIGRDGYSLIGQGKIEAILNGRVDDRRSIIEEAIGITKYKFNKQEAQNKINNANENLTRINDILNTYHEYLKPLYIEQKKAKEFLKFSNELNQIETLIILNNLYKLNIEIKNLKCELSNYKIQSEEINVSKDKLENEKLKFENELDSISIEEKEKRDSYYKIKDEIQLCNDDLINHKGNINVLINSGEIYKKQMSENLIKIENINSRENIINRTKLELSNEFDQINNYLNSFNDIFESKNNEILFLNSELDDMKTRELKNFEDNTKFKSRIGFLNSQNESLEAEKQSLISDKNIINKRISDILNKISQKNFERETKNKDLIKYQNYSKELIKKVDNSKVELDTYKSKLEDFNKSIVMKKTNLNMLVQFENKYDGFNRTSKIIMNEISDGRLTKFKDKCFIVGSIFNTKQEYELAIETVIGGHISDIITDNDSIVIEIINYLKQNNLGRVTFHPLNLIKEFNNRSMVDLKGERGFIDYAINLINVDDKFIKIARNILGKTIICDNMDNGISIAKFINFSNRIVTLDSQIINSGGSITGGSNFSKNLNILGRKRKIDEQTANINEDIVKFRQMEDEFLNCKSVYEKLVTESKSVELSIQDIKLNLLMIDNELNLKNDVKMRELSDLNKKEVLIKELDVSILNNNNEIRSLTEDLISNENMAKNIKLDITTITNKIENYRKKIKDEEDKITADKITKAKLEENISNICQEIERIALEKKSIILSNQNIQKEFDYINLKINENNLNIKIIQDKIDKLIEQNKANEKEFDKYIIVQNEIKNKIKELNTYIDDAKQKVYMIENNMNGLQLKLVKFELEFNTLNERLLNEYKLEFHEENGEKYLLENSKISSYNKRIQLLKGSISELGSVNLKSIEEYEELSKKVEFMTAQKEDLDKSKDELERFISEITIKMKKIFNENFKIINSNFDKTFKDLFRGGSASLVLGEGDELESNIDIIVQPPGKKLQNLNLLSGGEKGLSAISLLFAILRMKPAPFCVLDEIEAALDDSNVLRFNEFLKRFSENIQFIIITHKKTTMESSDIIYGVTMQEKGISKIVSINLANYKV